MFILDNNFFIIDLAKLRDYTVISVFDRTTNAQVYQERFNQLDWNFQVKKIKSVVDKYNHAGAIIDSTGIGDPVTDFLLRAGIPLRMGQSVYDIKGSSLRPYKITQQTKKQLVEKLSIWIDQKNFTILNIPETINEFESFRYELSETGHVRYSAPPGLFDDIVISIGLAVMDLYPVVKQEPKAELTPMQKHFKETKKKHEGSDPNEETDIMQDFFYDGWFSLRYKLSGRF